MPKTALRLLLLLPERPGWLGWEAEGWAEPSAVLPKSPSRLLELAPLGRLLEQSPGQEPAQRLLGRLLELEYQGYQLERSLGRLLKLPGRLLQDWLV